MTEGANVHLFSYGTLRLDSVQLATFGRLLDGADDAMPGYRKYMLEIMDPEVLKASGERYHPVVSPSDNPCDFVSGRVFTVTAAELAAADSYEVSDYRRVEVALASGENA